jgi:hypothetical protein
MRHSYVFLFFCLLIVTPAFSQESGIIQCDPGSTSSVPAWVMPGRPHILSQLSCGQTVSVLGVGSFDIGEEYSSRPREYVKIQLGDKVGYVDAKNVLLSKNPVRSSVNKNEQAAAKPKRPGDDEEQKKWNTIAKDNVTLRDETLLNTMYRNGPRTFKATLNNKSQFPVSDLRLLVRLYDCSGKPKSDRSNCEIIGEVTPVVPVAVPAGQTRRITASMLFESTPPVRGTFAWDYKVLGVRVE